MSKLGTAGADSRAFIDRGEPSSQLSRASKELQRPYLQPHCTVLGLGPIGLSAAPSTSTHKYAHAYCHLQFAYALIHLLDLFSEKLSLKYVSAAERLTLLQFPSVRRRIDEQ